MANGLKAITPFGGGDEVLELTIDWTATTGGASTTSTADIDFMTQTVSEVIKGRYLVEVQTVPDGTTAPTASYDVAINDANGEDIMDGGLADRSATAAESVFPASDGVNAVVPIMGDLSIAVTNAGDTKKGKTILIME